MQDHMCCSSFQMVNKGRLIYVTKGHWIFVKLPFLSHLCSWWCEVPGPVGERGVPARVLRRRGWRRGVEYGSVEVVNHPYTMTARPCTPVVVATGSDRTGQTRRMQHSCGHRMAIATRRRPACRPTGRLCGHQHDHAPQPPDDDGADLGNVADLMAYKTPGGESACCHDMV